MENRKIAVLLIEDSIDDAELLKRKLEKSTDTKFQVMLAQKLEDGLEMAEKNQPDLIISDLGLPDSHGLDTVTKILLAVPCIPLVVLSGFDDEDIAIKAVQSGAQDYLVKGRLDNSQLERSIYYSIERVRLQRELEHNTQEISRLHGNLLKILENSADAVVVVSEDGRIQFTNPAVENLFGHKQKELIKQPFQFPLNTGKTEEIEIRQAGGKTTIAEMTVVKISWEGEPASIVSMHNITERKRMENALRESEEKYRNIVELSHEGIIITNLKGVITSCNLTFLKMIGFPQEEVVGKHFTDIPKINIKDIPLYTKLFTSLLSGKKNPSLEIPWKVKNGETRVLELKSSLMKADGTVFGVQTIATDITERKQAQEALRALSSRQEAILAAVPDIIMEVDTNKVYTWVNKAGRDFFGDDVIGKEASFYFEGEQDTYDRVKPLFNGSEGVIYVESWQRRRDGEKRLLAWWCRVLKDEEGTVTGALSTARDITERKKAEESLRISEEKFSKAFLNSPEAIVISDIDDSTVIDANNTFLQFSGYTCEEIIGKKANEMSIWVTPEERTETIRMLKEEGIVRNRECDFRMKNGELRTWLFSAEIINIGNKPCMLSVNADITERKKIGEALANEAIRRRILIEQSSDGIVILDQNAKVYEANQRFAEMLGYSPEEIAQLHVWDWAVGSTHERSLEMMRTADEKGSHFETKHRRKDGTIYDVEISTNGAMFAGQKLVFCVCRDITERNKAEEALKQSEEKYRELINTSTDAIVSADQQMKVTIWNHGAEKMFGYTEKEMLGQSILKIVPEMARKPMAEGFSRFSKTGARTVGNGILEDVGVRKDGTEVPVELSMSTRKAGDKYIATAIIRDITVRKEAEDKLRRIDEMKSEFLSNVSHELRTPLQSISGFTKLIMTGKVPDPAVQQEFLQIIDRETMHLGNLINSLLDISRLEAGRFQIYKKLVPVQDIFIDSIKMFHSLAREKNITLHVDIPAQLPDIEIDSERMRQVVINLLSNAIKFSDPGSSVSAKAAIRDNMLLFQVADHGTGIRKEAMAHLFERFYRAEGETVRGGTGLGLYISRQIIEAHNGQIWAQSKYGEGSTFSFTLPLNNKGGDKNGKEDTGNRRRPGNSKTGRLLTKAGRVSNN